ncbi:MAG TPA: FliM/FliN family flagellar motor switch protein [Armatimonadota bacterium]|nr:FliM/FliN family flagellar motor switch protein [Armatimonadota bacterium]
MDLNDLLAEVEGIGEDRFIPSKSFARAEAAAQEERNKEAEVKEQPVAQPQQGTAKVAEAVSPTRQQDSVMEASPAPVPPQEQPSLQVEQLFGVQPEAPPPMLGSLDMVLDVELELTVELGKARIPLKDLMRIKPGNEFPLDQYPENPLGIYVNERLVAYGEALIVDGSLAVKITEILSSSPD